MTVYDRLQEARVRRQAVLSAKSVDGTQSPPPNVVRDPNGIVAARMRGQAATSVEADTPGEVIPPEISEPAPAEIAPDVTAAVASPQRRTQRWPAVFAGLVVILLGLAFLSRLALPNPDTATVAEAVNVDPVITAALPESDPNTTEVAAAQTASGADEVVVQVEARPINAPKILPERALRASVAEISEHAPNPILAQLFVPDLAPALPNISEAPIARIQIGLPDYAPRPAPRELVAELPLPPVAEIEPASVSRAASPDTEIVTERFASANIVLHVPNRVGDATVGATVQNAADAGINFDQTRVSPLTISRTNVRFFHTADAEAASALAEAIGGTSRDFTSFRPSPEAGTVEVWLAGRGVAPQTTNSSGGLAADLRRIEAVIRRVLSGEG